MLEFDWKRYLSEKSWKDYIPDMYVIGLSLIILGISIAAMGFVTLYYKKRFSAEMETYDAVVTKLKPLSGWMNFEKIVNIYAEYNVMDERIEGTHYIYVPMRNIDFEVGSEIEIKVDPTRPKVFMIEKLAEKRETLILQKNAPLLSAIGVGLTIAGAVLAVLGYPY